MDTVTPPGTGLDRTRLAELLRRERAAFAAGHPRSADANGRAGSLFGRVPMTWMNKASGGFPLYLASARGARVTDIDGHSLTTFPSATPLPWPGIHRRRYCGPSSGAG